MEIVYKEKSNGAYMLLALVLLKKEEREKQRGKKRQERRLLAPRAFDVPHEKMKKGQMAGGARGLLVWEVGEERLKKSRERRKAGTLSL